MASLGVEPKQRSQEKGDSLDSRLAPKDTLSGLNIYATFPPGVWKVAIGEKKIPPKLDANLVKQCLYQLNPRYKERVKVELDKILEAGIIEPFEES